MTCDGALVMVPYDPPNPPVKWLVAKDPVSKPKTTPPVTSGLLG